MMPAGLPVIAACLRCKAPCTVNPERNPEARLLRHATEAVGFCADCAFTQFLKEQSPLGTLLEKGPGGIDRLLDPTYQTQMAALLRVGNADARPSELSWPHIVASWHLPFPRAPRAARKKKGGAP